MKTELFEKLIRKIVREELEFYTTKVINEIILSKWSKTGTPVNIIESTDFNKAATMEKNVNISPINEKISKYKQMLDIEYGNTSDTMSFDGMQVPPELESVFNKNYSDFMKKLK